MKQHLKKATFCFSIILFSVFGQHGQLFSQGTLGYEVVFENPRIDDVVIDRHNRIITVDASTNQIRAYNTKGTLLREIRLPEEQSPRFHAEYSTRKLAVDTSGNVYCLTLSLEYFVSITKFDTAGNLIKRFDADSKMPKKNERIIDFFVSSSNKMYLNTFPHGKTRAETNPVYAYDVNGNQLGKLDYHIEDIQGNVYRLDTSQKDGIILDKYQQTQTRPSRELSKLSEKKIKGNVFVGIDGANNIYVAGPDQIAKFDHNLQELQAIRAPLKELEAERIFTNHRNIRVGYDGTIYLFGQLREISKEKEGDYAKVTSVLIRVKTP